MPKRSVFDPIDIPGDWGGAKLQLTGVWPCLKGHGEESAVLGFFELRYGLLTLRQGKVVERKDGLLFLSPPAIQRRIQGRPVWVKMWAFSPDDERRILPHVLEALGIDE